MKTNFLSSSTILKKFLVFNLIIFLVLGIFTYLYLNAIKPNLIKSRSNHHSKIIKNTTDHINRLNIEFTKESATKFLLDARFLFQNLDRVQLYDLNSNLLADTDTLDLVQDIFIENKGIQEILTKSKPDAVIIATPNYLHKSQAFKFLKSKIPVLLEKPISDNIKSAKKIINSSM